MKLYLSGPMTGIENLNREAFRCAAVSLRGAGYTVVCPHELNVDQQGLSWHAYMKRDVQALAGCDGVALLPNWESSRGAVIEARLARDLRMESHTVAEWMIGRVGA